MEQIIHQINALRSAHPDWDCWSMDADNAFNRVNKYEGLREMLVHAPKAFTFMKEMYFHQSNQFYFSGSEIKIIHSMVGFHQGDVLGTWAFMIAIQPLLDELHKELHDKCVMDTLSEVNLL